MPARIIVSGGQKGGTGKTTLSTNLAVHFAYDKKRVLLVDADSQGSAVSWANDRAAMGGPDPIPVKVLSGNLFYSLLELERHYDVIIVDAGGADSDEFRTAVARASSVYPTIMPSKVDLKTMALIDQYVGEARAAGNDELVARVVINKAPAAHQSQWRTATAREYLAQFKNLCVADTALCFRVQFQDAYEANKAVAELGESTAAAEMATLYAEVVRDAG